MKQKKMMQTKRIAWTLCMTFLLFVIAIFLIDRWENQQEIAQAGQMLTDYERKKELILDGERYLPNKDKYLFLLGGVDSFAVQQQANSYNNSNQVDFLALFIFDSKENTGQILQINRDTMMDVPVLGIGGKSAGTAFEQIALSHTYGSGLQDSAENTVHAVESLLNDITIDNYVMVSMDAIAILNDKIGGVTVEITEDLTAIHPDFVAGQTVLLEGDTALQYVRRRIDVSDGTNLARMERQKQYMQGFYLALKDATLANDQFLIESFGEIADYTVTNCDYGKLEQLQAYLQTVSALEIQSIAGEAKMGEEYIEFYPDEDALTALIVKLFYQKAEE